MTADRHEAAVLLAILRDDWERFEALLRARSPDPDSFVSLTRACDVHPYVHARLESTDRLDFLGPEAASRLDSLRKKCRTDNLLLLARLEKALDLLLEAGIVPIALKGIDVLHRFPLRFDERAMDDVDLLLRPEEFSGAIEIFRGAGWFPEGDPDKARWLGDSFEKTLVSPGPIGVPFDLHRAIAQAPRYRVDLGEVLERAVPLEVAGRRILRLEDHDAAAHLLLHHIQHYFDRRLKWAIDFRWIVGQESFDWHRLGGRLTEWGGAGAASLSLRYVHKVLPDAVPRHGLEAVPLAWWRGALIWPLRSRHPLDLFRGTRRRQVQLYLGAAALERPWTLPRLVLRRPGGASPPP